MTRDKLWTVLAGSAVVVSALTLAGFAAASTQPGGPPPPGPRYGGNWQCPGPWSHVQGRWDHPRGPSSGWMNHRGMHRSDRFQHFEMMRGSQPGRMEHAAFHSMWERRGHGMWGHRHHEMMFGGPGGGLYGILIGAHGKGHGPHHAKANSQQRWMMGRIGRAMVLRSQLNLTADQQNKIRTILKDQQPTMWQAMQPVMEKRMALHELVLSGQASDKSIRQAADALGKAAAQAATTMSKTAAKVRAVLNAQQRKAVDAYLAGNREAAQQFMKMTSAKNQAMPTGKKTDQ